MVEPEVGVDVATEEVDVLLKEEWVVVAVVLRKPEIVLEGEEMVEVLLREVGVVREPEALLEDPEPEPEPDLEADADTELDDGDGAPVAVTGHQVVVS